MKIVKVRFLKQHIEKRTVIFMKFGKRNISKLSKINNYIEKHTVIQMKIVKVLF